MPGPAPNPNARRRNARVGTVQLPAEGRRKPAPQWPGDGDGPEMWHTLWSMPQAVMWERQRLEHVVARYTAMLILANAGSLPAAGEARQMEDRLGLTPKAMRQLMWEIVEDEVAEARTTPAKRRTLKVVGGDAVDPV